MIGDSSQNLGSLTINNLRKFKIPLERKESALRRKEAEKKREYLRRIGKLEDVSETGYPYQKKK